jgi:dUTP pyrophosphatase
MNTFIIIKMEKLYIKILDENAREPKRANSMDAGYDISSCIDTTIPSKSRAIIPSGISICIPEGTYGRIAPRSGLAANSGIDVLAGVVDRSYTGEVKVILYNTSDSNFRVNIGDRIAQLILEKISTPEIEIVKELPSLDNNTRGDCGFGSTG